MAAEPGKKAGWHLPEWAREWAMKLLPWAFMAVIAAGLGLFMDNIGNKKDIARNHWRHDQRDIRDERHEKRMDRLEGEVDQLRNTQNEFQNEVLHRLDILLEMRERQRRRRQ